MLKALEQEPVGMQYFPVHSVSSDIMILSDWLYLLSKVETSSVV
jgi:hypothetical protein